ncbi:PLD nuclease N-terminal domain-containing protein [Virgibacillus oceani]
METLQEINWQLIAPLFVIQAILLLVAIIDWAKTDEFRGPKWMWFFIIVFGTVIGPIIYFIFGRGQR